MDISKLSHGAKVVLGGTIAFLILSVFSWFHYTGPGKEQFEAIGGDTGITMWHGIGWLAGLLAIALVVWQVIRLANIELEIGVTPSMVTAALAVLMALFAVIRFLSKPGGDFVGRTFWAWVGVVLALVVVGGAWMNMKAAGESLSDVKDKLTSGAAAASAAARPASPEGSAAAAPPATPAPTAPVPTAPAPTAPAEPGGGAAESAPETASSVEDEVDGPDHPAA